MQTGWNFTDTAGRRHAIGLYHGDRSGHLMLYCDRLVVRVDFSVKDSRQYAFFVEEDWVEVNLKNVAGKFEYELAVNHEIVPDAQRVQRNRERIWAWQTAMFFLGTATLILTIILAVRACKN